ncbi:hypothetical protein TNCT_390371 [Trichonephila clavata]|uniref:Uncharacterized protein n=1 Tax=Trichonephila clavata TaxID=2740835 RepID=A0A8X6KXX1_TRICU|nr:hypothetical protein TNCT_390371 [Trichonephila clavata]
MAPKTKEISLDMRKHITELHKAKTFPGNRKNFKTVIYNRWLHRKKVFRLAVLKISPDLVGPGKLTSRAKRVIVRSATNKPMTSAQNIANELLLSCNVSVSVQTV